MLKPIILSGTYTLIELLDIVRTNYIYLLKEIARMNKFMTKENKLTMLTF